MKRKAKWIVAALLCAMLIALLYAVFSGLFGTLPLLHSDSGEKDPMFMEPVETVTRPPELDAEETQRPHGTLDDIEIEDGAPVERTADELALEAEQKAC